MYEARDLASGEQLALKILHAADAASVYSFKAEFRALAGIVHENLVQLHELFVAKDESFFTMEFVDGLDFDATAWSDRISSPSQAYSPLREAFASLVDGVKAIHRAGKLHCDLKPSNVRVSRTGRVVILDYGLVFSNNLLEAERKHTTRPSPRGTPEYLSPELALGGLPTTASDVYALGVMLFVALTGRLPFTRYTEPRVDTLQARAAPRARSVADGVPADLDELCACMLEREAALRPTLDEIWRRLGASTRGRHQPTAQTAATTLVGRGPELSQLHAALHATAQEHPIAVLVSAASGIGKSALLDEFAQQACDVALVLAGRCYEREALPYKAFDGVIDALAERLQTLAGDELAALLPDHLGALVQVFPALKRVPEIATRAPVPLAVDSQELRHQAFAALKHLLSALSGRRPVILVVDDLQWADLDSAQLLLELVGPPAAPRMLYVGSVRSEDEPRCDFLREVLASPLPGHGPWELRRLTLAPLDTASCTSLAIQLLRDQVAYAEAVAAHIAREAAGVPIFARELVHHFASHPADELASLSLAQLLSSRFASLSEQSRQLIALLALAARPVPATVLAHAAAPHTDWSSTLRALQVRGLIRGDGKGAFLIYHDRFRELCVDFLSAPQRAALHRALAGAYEHAEHTDPELPIAHWRGAGDSARALECAIAAADAAGTKLAFHRASALYATALEIIDATDPRAPNLHVRLGEALSNAGRSQDAAGAFLAAAERSTEPAAWSLRCRATQQALRGDVHAGRDLVKQVLAEAGIRVPRTTPELIARVVWARMQSAAVGMRRVGDAPSADPRGRRRLEVLRAVFRESSVADPMRGFLYQQMFHAQALRVGDPDAVFVGRAWDTYNRALAAGPRNARWNARRLAELELLAERLGSSYARATLALVRAATALFEGRYLEVETPATTAQQLFGEQCVGAFWEESVCCSLRCTAIEITGPIDRLQAHVPVLWRRARERGDRFLDPYVSMAMTLGLLAHDEPATAQDFVEQHHASAPADVQLPRFLLRNRLMDCLRYRGENAKAWQLWEEGWRAFTRSVYSRVGLISIMMHHQRARCALAMAAESGEESFIRIAEREAEIVRRLDRPESRGLSSATLAAVALQRGRLELARARLLEAVRASQDAGILAYAVSFRWHLERLAPAGGVNSAEAELRAQGILRPERWVEVYAPGFHKDLRSA